MNWDQIEDSWAAMTRRVRPDLPGLANFVGQSLLSPTDAGDARPGALDAPDQPKAQIQAPAPIQTA